MKRALTRVRAPCPSDAVCCRAFFPFGRGRVCQQKATRKSWILTRFIRQTFTDESRPPEEFPR
jgi:hypothetical protein